MGKLYKTSRAVIATPDANVQYVYLLESENPEKKLASRLRDFLKTVGYSEIYPHFNNLRVGTIHPFAILLSQDVLGQKQSVNVFPAITVVAEVPLGYFSVL